MVKSVLRLFWACSVAIILFASVTTVHSRYLPTRSNEDSLDKLRDLLRDVSASEKILQFNLDQSEYLFAIFGRRFWSRTNHNRAIIWRPCMEMMDPLMAIIMVRNGIPTEEARNIYGNGRFLDGNSTILRSP